MRRALPAAVLALLLAGASCAQRASSGTVDAVRPAVASDAWPTYNRDTARSGVDAAEPKLGALRRTWAARVDGDVYGQPLVVRGRVFVATENDSVYALDAGTGRTAWRAHLGSPVNGSDLPCGDIDPSGITGTPAIDTRTGTLFAVAFLAAPRHHELYALDIRTGRTRWHRRIDAPGADPSVHQQRPALALTGGRVYVAFGGLFGDCGDYHGTVVGVREDTGGGLVVYRVPSSREGGIWAPPGPSVTSSGDLLVATGNSEASATFDYGDAVVRLSPALKVVDFFADAGWVALNAADVDLGSTSPLPLRDGLVFQIGKAGVGYLLHADHLGGVGGQAFLGPVCAGGAYGGSAYAAPVVYVPCRDGLTAVRVSGATFTVAWKSSTSNPGPPIVAGGAVWTIALDTGVLQALDPASGALRTSANVGTTAHFASPSTGGGRIFVPAGRTVVAFTGV